MAISASSNIPYMGLHCVFFHLMTLQGGFMTTAGQQACATDKKEIIQTPRNPARRPCRTKPADDKRKQKAKYICREKVREDAW
jgi:hypothetical protein